MKRTLAIDPGASGGFAWQLNGQTYCTKMPESDEQIVAFIRSASCWAEQVVLEKVGGFIAGNAAPGSRMFNFGDNFGVLKGATLAFGLRLVLVRPQEWQSSLNIGKKKDFNFTTIAKRGKRRGKLIPKNNWKEHLVQVAKESFPQLNVTKETADALLILKYSQLC